LIICWIIHLKEIPQHWQYGGLRLLHHSNTFLENNANGLSSWVPMKGARKLTRTMIDEFLAKTTGPKKLIEAWELAKDPPSPFSYLLEKKYQYHTLMEKYKAL
jgi:hypothetical protein